MEILEAKSLRIGNLLKRLDDSIFEVSSEDISIISNWTGNEFGLPKPIALTEEWLLKCGFESDTIFGFNIKYKKGNFELWYSKQKNIFLVENLKIIKCEPKYLHQLQNLYFALTGTELIIKL